MHLLSLIYTLRPHPRVEIKVLPVAHLLFNLGVGVVGPDGLQLPLCRKLVTQLTGYPSTLY